MQAIKSAERQMDHGEAFSFFQILNLLVYISLASGLIYFINRDYGNVITIWFVNAFPREAETLGLHNK